MLQYLLGGFNNGIILQWGRFTGSGNFVVTLPISYTTTLYSPWFCYINNANDPINVRNIAIWDVTINSFTQRTSAVVYTKLYGIIGY